MGIHLNFLSYCVLCIILAIFIATGRTSAFLIAYGLLSCIVKELKKVSKHLTLQLVKFCKILDYCMSVNIIVKIAAIAEIYIYMLIFQMSY